MTVFEEKWWMWVYRSWWTSEELMNGSSWWMNDRTSEDLMMMMMIEVVEGWWWVREELMNVCSGIMNVWVCACVRAGVLVCVCEWRERWWGCVEKSRRWVALTLKSYEVLVMYSLTSLESCLFFLQTRWWMNVWWVLNFNWPRCISYALHLTGIII